jgi:hypothetical protein
MARSRRAGATTIPHPLELRRCLVDCLSERAFTCRILVIET